MTSFRQGDYDSREAGADLSTKQYYVVKTDSNGKYVLASAATDAIAGVLVNAPKLGETADVANINGSGTFKVAAGGTIAKDAYLTTDANGKAIATTTTGNRVFGRAVAAAVSGDIVEYRKSNEKY
ncbi:DUF2190 family protein [Mycolicibacterium sp. PDY-3]|uniref:DUF2190 family protein n=1 Tax=Mycolicibacterium sp. PDY-3 TaxID=3376069 RepID=UPI0037A8B3E6